MILAAAIIITAGVLLFTLFLRSSDVPEAAPASPTGHLEERKAIIHENLRDLGFEYRLGKLSDADYQMSKEGLQRELATVMAAIDRAGGGAPPPAPAAAAPAVGLVCPHCAARFAQPLRFCGECGKPMQEARA